MKIWIKWWEIVQKLRPAFSRKTTFLWFASCLLAFSIRGDLFGVSSFVRCLGLKKENYDSLLHFFHSSAVKLNSLNSLWLRVLLQHLPGIHRVNGRICLIGDGIKFPKSGKKMPAVKHLHQSSDSNSKPQYIMGHSFQVLGLLCKIKEAALCVPVTARIHEGVVFSNADRRTLLDKMVELVGSLLLGDCPANIILDGFYCAGKMVKGLLEQGHHLVCRVKSNATAYYSHNDSPTGKRGRPRKYGKKVKLKNLFCENSMCKMNSPVYGEQNIEILYRSIDLLWRPAGQLVRFVLVIHPHRGRVILMTTDLKMSPVQIIGLYGYRFKIEVSFKQAIYTLGTYQYHFWMKNMTPIKRKGGNQYLHRKNKKYTQDVKRKIRAYHCYVQVAVIAQGLLQYLSITQTDLIWKHFGSWLRTIRPGICPSEYVCSIAMKNTFPDFLSGNFFNDSLQKFIRSRIDLDRAEGIRLVA